MNKIEKLIKQMCPQGVPTKKLCDIASYKDGAAHEHIMGETGKYVVTKVKFISSDGSFRMYADKRLSPVEKNDIIMVMSDLPNGKSLAKCFLIDEDNKYTINQRVCSLTPNEDYVIPEYLYYVLNRNKQLLKYDTGYTQTHLKKAYILKVEVPIPPKEIQKEIVRILDGLKRYISIIEQELNLREKQADWARQILLNRKDDKCTRKLARCCSLEKGKTAIQKATPGKYPMVVTAAERKSSDDFQFDRPTVCIPLVSSRGHGVASINQLFYQEGQFALGNILCGVTPVNPEELDAKYLFYYLNYKKDILIVPLMKGGANVSVTVDALKKIKISYPTVEIQKDVVQKLEQFDLLCETIEKEIAARKKQYDFFLEKVMEAIY
ncbi:restriction endonuclease subunit S [Lachnospiraceae bacterium HCP1S3_A8]